MAPAIKGKPINSIIAVATKALDSEESILNKSIKIINKVNTIGAYNPWKLFFDC